MNTLPEPLDMRGTPAARQFSEKLAHDAIAHLTALRTPYGLAEAILIAAGSVWNDQGLRDPVQLTPEQATSIANTLIAGGLRI
jgi:hypothetical protein